MNSQPPLETTPAPTKKSLLTKLKIPGVVVGIVALEWLAAFLVMPSSGSTAPTSPVAAAVVMEENEPAPAAEETVDAHASDHAKKGAEEKSGHDKGHGEPGAKAAPKHSGSEEVDLGKFTVSGFQPASNSTLFITFHLYGTVRHKYAEEFNQRLEESQHRIRDNIIVIIRSAEITDLTDAGLGLIKRRILETTNKTLGKPLLQEVVFSEFSFIEQ